MISNNAQIIDLPTTKICTGCNEQKSIAEFPKQNNRGDVLGIGYFQCKKCISKKMKKYHKSVYETRRNYKKKYGLTLEDVQNMLKVQMGLCANRACGKKLSLDVKVKLNQKAVVDHCHSTGKVRGLLCISCNTALGILENKNMVFGLTEYLQKHGG